MISNQLNTVGDPRESGEDREDLDPKAELRVVQGFS